MIALAPDLVAAPPIELWPKVVGRVLLPDDVEARLLSEQPGP